MLFFLMILPSFETLDEERKRRGSESSYVHFCSHGQLNLYLKVTLLLGLRPDPLLMLASSNQMIHTHIWTNEN